MIWWPKRAWKMLKIKDWCPKRGKWWSKRTYGGQKEPMVVKKNLKRYIMYIFLDSELRVRSDILS